MLESNQLQPFQNHVQWSNQLQPFQNHVHYNTKCQKATSKQFQPFQDPHPVQENNPFQNQQLQHIIGISQDQQNNQNKYVPIQH